MEILKNMEFWAVFIATVSLFVSVWPRVYARFKGGRLEVETQEHISITHKLGHSNLCFFINIINSGGIDVRVKRAVVTLVRDGRTEVLHARNYQRTPDSQTPTIFTSFTLKPGEEFGHLVTFLPKFSREKEKDFRGLEAKAKKETQAPLGDPLSVAPRPLSPETYAKIMAEYETNYAWRHGEYTLTLSVEALTSKQFTIEKNFRFTLYESDEHDLRDLATGYITGDGVCFYSGRVLWFEIPIISFEK